ncbi:hypothetical protein HK405_004195 [Cladochytrium tenue]|nr:hypothetical protein HK405_004195 [Cladochytrium tenue]
MQSYNPSDLAGGVVALLADVSRQHQRRWDAALKAFEAKEGNGTLAADYLWAPPGLAPPTPPASTHVGDEDGGRGGATRPDVPRPLPDSCIVCFLNVGSASVPGDAAVVEEWATATDGFVKLRLGKGRPYSFAEYSSVQAARAALLRLVGRRLPSPAGGRPTMRALLATPAVAVPFPDVDVLTDAAEIMHQVPGLFVVPELVSPEEETELLARVEEYPWVELSVRKVQHHGFAFNYDVNEVSRATQPPLPPWTDALLHRFCSLPDLPPGTPAYNQLTVNHYPPGTGIPPHTDTHSGFGDSVLIVSLGGPAVMEFRTLLPASTAATVAAAVPPDDLPGLPPADPLAPPTSEFRTVHVLLAPRTAVEMHGEARFGWEHGIRARAGDVVDGRLVPRRPRTSLTFRRIREPPPSPAESVPGTESVPPPPPPRCDCAYRWICDARLPGGALPDRFRSPELTVNRHGVARNGHAL